MNDLSFDALDALTGEVLPERAVLGVVSTPFNNAGESGGNTTVVTGGNHGATAISACQSTHSEGTPGLLGSVGLGSNNPSESVTCTPGAVSSY
ncbi:hypothetical protein [Amycolatopsis eburnea]|uniref:Uncharacterized protein n=1 Tax=Amycolatopsis eburnea TaxID=2267691 RepID=A0A427TGJ4_9PSEU|nr:hypothetical protein [Amycolatopsis eburnea]RSD22164.1 hypothetical protein EIY87_10205 [Amycolatopsis eburnea]